MNETVILDRESQRAGNSGIRYECLERNGLGKWSSERNQVGESGKCRYQMSGGINLFGFALRVVPRENKALVSFLEARAFVMP
jgi:hypothetical protein